MVIQVNNAGMSHARSLIAAGKVNKTADWSFSADDGNALLGASGDNWAVYSQMHLATDSSADPETKEHYKYPFGKGGQVYRSGLVAIRQRAGQQGADNIFDAAGTLLELIDGEGKSMNRKHSDFKFQVKQVAEDGTFEGYGSVFGVKDSYGDIVMPGAFADSLSAHKAAGTMPALLWQHDSDDVCGVWLEMVEDNIGLKVRGQLAIKTGYGSDAYELLKLKAISGLSIGYATVEDEYDRISDSTKLHKLDLWEVSLVTFPANTSARVSAVKSINDLKSAEQYLRDAGLSRKDATAFVSRVKGLVRSDSDTDDAVAVQGLLEAVKRRPMP